MLFLAQTHLYKRLPLSSYVGLSYSILHSAHFILKILHFVGLRDLHSGGCSCLVGEMHPGVYMAPKQFHLGKPLKCRSVNKTELLYDSILIRIRIYSALVCVSFSDTVIYIHSLLFCCPCFDCSIALCCLEPLVRLRQHRIQPIELIWRKGKECVKNMD